jgi:hypothetical protein
MELEDLEAATIGRRYATGASAMGRALWSKQG